jgi:hypothetical protein
MGLTIKSTDQLMRERQLLPSQNMQVFIDSEAVRMMSPYTPMRTGAMRDSAYSGTEFGSGEIKQTAPYSNKQYYDEKTPHRGITTHHWFEAMKSNGGVAKILNGAARLAGARGIKA